MSLPKESERSPAETLDLAPTYKSNKCLGINGGLSAML